MVRKCCTNKTQGTYLPFRFLALSGHRAENISGWSFGYFKNISVFMLYRKVASRLEIFIFLSFGKKHQRMKFKLFKYIARKLTLKSKGAQFILILRRVSLVSSVLIRPLHLSKGEPLLKIWSNFIFSLGNDF